MKVFDDNKRCHICYTKNGLQLHHIYNGYAFRQVSDGFEYKGEKYKATCYLCLNHHTGQDGVHNHADKLRELKRECQEWLEQEGISESEFRKLFGRSYKEER